MARAPKGTPTHLNIAALADLVADRGIMNAELEFTNQIESTSVQHVRRCMKAGLVEVASRARLRLTPEGAKAVIPHLVDRIQLFSRADHAATPRGQRMVETAQTALAILSNWKDA